jgi:hypothetical protein
MLNSFVFSSNTSSIIVGLFKLIRIKNAKITDKSSLLNAFIFFKQHTEITIISTKLNQKKKKQKIKRNNLITFHILHFAQVSWKTRLLWIRCLI